MAAGGGGAGERGWWERPRGALRGAGLPSGSRELPRRSPLPEKTGARAPLLGALSSAFALDDRTAAGQRLARTLRGPHSTSCAGRPPRAARFAPPPRVRRAGRSERFRGHFASLAFPGPVGRPASCPHFTDADSRLAEVECRVRGRGERGCALPLLPEGPRRGRKTGWGRGRGLGRFPTAAAPRSQRWLGPSGEPRRGLAVCAAHFLGTLQPVVTCSRRSALGGGGELGPWFPAHVTVVELFANSQAVKRLPAVVFVSTSRCLKLGNRFFPLLSKMSPTKKIKRNTMSPTKKIHSIP